MRIRKHRITFLLLLSSLPSLFSDESSSLMLHGDDEDENDVDDFHKDLREQQQEQDSHQAADDLVSAVTTETESASSPQHRGKKIDQQQEQQQEEPSRRPQHENDVLALSHEYENPRFDEEERIPKGYSSSLATDDSDGIDSDSDIYFENNENDDTADNEQDLGEDIEESASQAVHEDGFRLPVLSKTEIVFENFSNPEDTDWLLPKLEDSSIIESQIIETISDDFSEEEESEPIELSDRVETDDFSHETLYNLGHSHIEATKIERESIFEEVVVDEGFLGSFGSIGTTNTDEAEVEDEEVVVMKNSKLAIGTTGTTSIESIEGDDDDDGGNVQIINSDDLVIDGELLIGNDRAADGSSANEIIETGIENTTKETLVDRADKNGTTEPVELVDNDSISGDRGQIIDDATDVAGIDAGISAGQVVEDEDHPESSGDDEGGAEIKGDDDDEEVEGSEIEEDDEDEDLADRVSVDYASKSAGALIIEKTAEFKGTSNLITGDRDRYAIVPCSEEKKHVVLSLSEDILVKEIKLANYERFSSTVKDFQVKGSHTLGKWVDLGTYNAESGNGEQTFVLENPTWARYLKFRFLTHHGVEWYCTLSQIKVHGSNMVQGFHEQWEIIEEENNEEQVIEGQSDDSAETSNADASENTDVKTDTKDIGDEVDNDENSSNSSVAPQGDDPENSTESDDINATEKVDSSPRHAQVTPFVHSKPKPLEKFRTPSDFSEIIQGEMVDEKLFTDLYNLIPRTMSNLPAHLKNDLICEVEEPELRSVHQIGMLAMESLYSIGSRIVDDIALMVTEDTGSRTISSPKMNGFSNEYYQKKFGSGLLDKLMDQSSTEIESSRNLTTDGSTRRSEESSTQQTNETHEDIRGQAAVTGDKSLVLPSKKEESSTTVANVSVEETANHSVDLAIFKLLKDLPSAECLVDLDFAEFKNKISATRKSTGTAGGSQGSRMMEPIFTKLTDEIFALQTSLSVHDQFAKMSVGCYQRVILDLALETEKLRRDQDERLRRLEEQILEPASLPMFYKLVASLISNTVTLVVSNGSLFFLSFKNVWFPKILRHLLSKDTYEGFYNALESIRVCWSQASYVFHTVLDHSSHAIKTLTIALESKEWAKRETYEEFLSAWSAYYDGGMVVVATVLTLIFCRMLMWCSSFPRRNNSGSSSRRQMSEHSRNGKSSSRTTQTVYSEERLHTPSTSKKHKRKSRKSKHRSRDRKIVPIVEDISEKASEESIPELEDESLHESSTMSANNRDGVRTANSPSVVSLEEE